MKEGNQCVFENVKLFDKQKKVLNFFSTNILKIVFIFPPPQQQSFNFFFFKFTEIYILLKANYQIIFII